MANAIATRNEGNARIKSSATPLICIGGPMEGSKITGFFVSPPYCGGRRSLTAKVDHVSYARVVSQELVEISGGFS